MHPALKRHPFVSSFSSIFIPTEPNPFRVCKALANLAAVYLFHDIHVRPNSPSGLDANQSDRLSRSLGHHVRTFAFDLPQQADLEQAHLANCAALILPNLPNIRYLTVLCHAWKTGTHSAIIHAIAKLQHLERVTFNGLGYRLFDVIHSPPSPTFFETLFNQILLSHAEQLTSLSLYLCPFSHAPGTLELLRGSAKNLQVLTLDASLPGSLWQVFAQPVTWACADRLVMLDLIEIHGIHVPILVEHIASGRFGNLKRLQIDMHWSDRDRQIVIPAIEWNIRPLDVLILVEVPKLELEILGCLHAKEVQVVELSEQAMIELVHGGSFREMTVLRIWQRNWKPVRLEELASACATRNVDLLVL